MKFRRLFSVSLLSVFAFAVPCAHALLAPQDNWRTYSNFAWTLTGTPRSLAIGPDDEVYLAVDADSVTAIEVFSRTGAPLRRFTTVSSLGSGRIVSMAFGPTGILYVFATDRQVRAYASDGTLASQWGGTGTGFGAFGSVTSATSWGLAVDSSGDVYVADVGNRLVQKFSSTGSFLNQWGGPGTLAGQFGSSGAMALAVTPQDKIVVAAQVTDRFLQLFHPDGSIISTPALSPTGAFSSSNALLSVTPDGLIAVGRTTSALSLYGDGLSFVGSLPSLVATKAGFAFNRRGDYYLATVANGIATVARYERSYSVENPPVANALPQPVLLSTEQRPSTPYIDIDYKVIDADDTTVRVALLGFVDGGNDLGKVLRPSTFVEGTAAHVGLGQATNEVRRVTWNAAADWAVEFGSVQIEVLAQDSRGLLPVHWITLPAQGADPAIEISQRPVTDAEWMHLWYWLIAIGDPSIALADGQITGVGGVFDGQVLATTSESVSTITAEGRAFLRAKCGVRALTEAEIARGAAGQFGFTEVNEFSVSRVPEVAP